MREMLGWFRGKRCLAKEKSEKMCTGPGSNPGTGSTSARWLRARIDGHESLFTDHDSDERSLLTRKPLEDTKVGGRPPTLSASPPSFQKQCRRLLPPHTHRSLCCSRSAPQARRFDRVRHDIEIDDGVRFVASSLSWSLYAQGSGSEGYVHPWTKRSLNVPC